MDEEDGAGNDNDYPEDVYDENVDDDDDDNDCDNDDDDGRNNDDSDGDDVTMTTMMTSTTIYLEIITIRQDFICYSLWYIQKFVNHF